MVIVSAMLKGGGSPFFPHYLLIVCPPSSFAMTASAAFGGAPPRWIGDKNICLKSPCFTPA